MANSRQSRKIQTACQCLGEQPSQTVAALARSLGVARSTIYRRAARAAQYRQQRPHTKRKPCREEREAWAAIGRAAEALIRLSTGRA